MNVGPVSDQVIGAGIVRASLAQTWTDGCDVINAAKFLIVQEDNTAVLLSCSYAEKTACHMKWKLSRCIQSNTIGGCAGKDERGKSLRECKSCS